MSGFDIKAFLSESSEHKPGIGSSAYGQQLIIQHQKPSPCSIPSMEGQQEEFYAICDFPTQTSIFFFFFESVAILQLSDLILILLVHDLRETNCKLTGIVREVTLPFLLPSSLDGKLKSWTWNPFFHLRARGWKIFLEAYNKSRTGREATDHEWAKTRVGKVYSRNFINSLGLGQGLLPMSRQAFDIDRLRLRYYIRSRANFVEARGREGLIKKYTGVITRKHGETVCGACIYIYVHVRPWIGWRIIHGV